MLFQVTVAREKKPPFSKCYGIRRAKGTQSLSGNLRSGELSPFLARNSLCGTHFNLLWFSFLPDFTFFSWKDFQERVLVQLDWSAEVCPQKIWRVPIKLVEMDFSNRNRRGLIRLTIWTTPYSAHTTGLKKKIYWYWGHCCKCQKNLLSQTEWLSAVSMPHASHCTDWRLDAPMKRFLLSFKGPPVYVVGCSYE